MKLVMRIDAKLDGVTWTDISGDVMDYPSASTGIFGNQDSDRVGGVGKLNFQLDNSIGNSAATTGYYSPGGAYCRSGFALGLPVRVVFTFDGTDTVMWIGEIPPKGILATPGIYGEKRTAVTCYDWMNQAIIHKLYLLAYTTNKRGDEAVNLILANMPKQPVSKTLDVGTYTFTSIFDTVRTYTTAMAEFQKICQSERSYLYIDTDGELIWENRTHRDALTAVTEIAVPTGDATALLDEDGTEILDEDGTFLLAEDTVIVTLDDSRITSMQPDYSGSIFNKVTYTVYPKETFTGTLAITQTRISLKAGETKTGIKLTYRDPTGGAAKVCLKILTAIVSDTDYKMSANLDGTGTNLIASLAVTLSEGVEAGEWTIQNTGATDGFVYLQIRGTGLRIYDPVSKITEDTASQTAYGVLELVIDAPYQNDPVIADSYASVILAGSKDPTREIKSVTFKTSNETNKGLFLGVKLGQRITLSETVTGITDDYFINGIEWSMIGYNDTDGALIQWTWYVKRAALDVYSFGVWDTTVWGSTDGWGF
jgi:hypothetical protein